jgi:hypothetical protein
MQFSNFDSRNFLQRRWERSWYMQNGFKPMLQVLASEVAPAVLIVEGQYLAAGTWYKTPAIPSLGLISHSFSPHRSIMGSPCSGVDNLAIQDYDDFKLGKHSQ